MEFSTSDDPEVDGYCECPMDFKLEIFCGGCGDLIERYAIGSTTLHFEGEHWHLQCAFEEMYERFEDEM